MPPPQGKELEEIRARRQKLRESTCGAAVSGPPARCKACIISR